MILKNNFTLQNLSIPLHDISKSKTFCETDSFPLGRWFSGTAPSSTSKLVGLAVWWYREWFPWSFINHKPPTIWGKHCVHLLWIILILNKIIILFLSWTTGGIIIMKSPTPPILNPENRVNSNRMNSVVWYLRVVSFPSCLVHGINHTPHSGLKHAHWSVKMQSFLPPGGTGSLSA